MKFYDCAPAPSPRRTRMLLAEKEVKIETVQVDLRNAEQLSAEFLAVNPNGTVPVLVTNAGIALTENVAIASYIEHQFPNPPLMGQTADERALCLMWNVICETQGFSAVAEAYRNSAPHLKGRATTGPTNFEQISDLAVRGRQRIDLFHDTLEKRLKVSSYLAFDQFSFADITGFVVCEFAAAIKVRVPENCPATLAWHAKIKSRPSALA